MTEKRSELIRTFLRVAAVVAVNLLIILLVTQGGAKESFLFLRGEGYVQALSQMGARGDEVCAVQKKLLELGLYTGKADGIFGENTKKAVVAFQKQRGLTADGIAGKRTLAALGLGGDGGNQSGGGSAGAFSQNDVNLMAKIISAEARGEPFSGQVAVGAVILNRMAHPSFPNTLGGVIYQPGAFSCLTDGGVNAPVADSAYKAARDAMGGQDPSGGAVYYYNAAKSTNKWIFSRPVITVIGKHRFCS